MKYFCEECGKRILKTKKEVYTCKVCGKFLCGKHSFFNPDENNIAITKSAPILCKEHYNLKYN